MSMNVGLRVMLGCVDRRIIVAGYVQKALVSLLLRRQCHTRNPG